MFPLLAAVQVGSVLAFLIYLLFDGPTQNEAQLEFELRVLPLTPVLWLALSVAGLVALRYWRNGWARPAARASTWVSGVFGLLGGAAFAFVLLLASSYGADFDYPSAPPTPAFAEMIAHAEASDDDDPMRGRERVIDIGERTEHSLVAYYRQHFPQSKGWSDGSSQPASPADFSLCLVNSSESGYDVYLEVYRYDHSFTSGGDGRFMVSISRLYVRSDWGPRTTDRCGVAGAWFPSDI
ncbi:MAG: hypothetical protein JWR90_544 [Marmoricola sp.]|nr:hypothetical protein [Marmoricola sp.]